MATSTPSANGDVLDVRQPLSVKTLRAVAHVAGNGAGTMAALYAHGGPRRVRPTTVEPWAKTDVGYVGANVGDVVDTPPLL